MTTRLERLRSEARALDADQRARLALDLLESLDASGPSSAQVERAWNLEAKERLGRYDAGDKRTISAEALHAGLDNPSK